MVSLHARNFIFVSFSTHTGTGSWSICSILENTLLRRRSFCSLFECICCRLLTDMHYVARHRLIVDVERSIWLDGCACSIIVECSAARMLCRYRSCCTWLYTGFTYIIVKNEHAIMVNNAAMEPDDC